VLRRSKRRTSPCRTRPSVGSTTPLMSLTTRCRWSARPWTSSRWAGEVGRTAWARD